MKDNSTICNKIKTIILLNYVILIIVEKFDKNEKK